MTQIILIKIMFRFDSRIVSKDGFRDSVQRGWNGNSQMHLIQVPLVQLLSRCRQYNSIRKRNNRSNTAVKFDLLRGHLDTIVTHKLLNLQKNKFKRRTQPSLRGRRNLLETKEYSQVVESWRHKTLSISILSQNERV